MGNPEVAGNSDGILEERWKLFPFYLILESLEVRLFCPEEFLASPSITKGVICTRDTIRLNELD